MWPEWQSCRLVDLLRYVCMLQVILAYSVRFYWTSWSAFRVTVACRSASLHSTLFSISMVSILPFHSLRCSSFRTWMVLMFNVYNDTSLFFGFYQTVGDSSRWFLFNQPVFFCTVQLLVRDSEMHKIILLLGVIVIWYAHSFNKSVVKYDDGIFYAWWWKAHVCAVSLIFLYILSAFKHLTCACVVLL